VSTKSTEVASYIKYVINEYEWKLIVCHCSIKAALKLGRVHLTEKHDHTCKISLGKLS